ncbi:MAG: hypothetical protein JST93_16725 [Acidobacteria bacterium]|nr:hypothetical protein [Acidobacteriota bacterium]
MNWAEMLVVALAVYAMAGVVFAVAFLWRGVERVDAGAHEAGLGVRLLLAPGCVALWPVLAAKWGRR